MNNHVWIKNSLALVVIAILAVLGYFYFQSSLLKEPAHAHAEEHEEPPEEFKRGPHNGRLLENQNFHVEVAIYEPGGVPPRFRIYFYDDNKNPISPSDVSYEMELQRINRLEKIPFKHVDGFLESTVAASEPHSFKVKINATHKDERHNWEYESYEGRVELSPETLKANNIKIETATPINLEVKLDVMGKIVPNEELTLYISPRFPGMVKSVNKRLGDYVRKGEVLAVIESNESLQNYEVKSEINGMIIKKNINLGMYLSGQENIFVISDLSSVWADFNIYRRDLSIVNLGEPIQVTSLDGKLNQESTVSYISPLGQETTQSIVARSVLSNPKGIWKPGLFVTGEITVDDHPVSVAVKDTALQKYRDWDVVFISVGDIFEVVPVQLGRRNKEWVEIKTGLSSGDRYVSDNSFILLADLEKAGAAHEH